MTATSFVHHLHRPDTADGTGLLLLHGTGGTERDLMPLGRMLAPQAVLLGVRGRARDEGVTRWFRRLEMARFDQAQIRSEAQAFADFLTATLAAQKLDPMRLTVLGYSNGANFAAALMAQHPGLLRRAILLRPMLVLENPPIPDLSGTEVLSLAGEADPYGRFAPALNAWLGQTGAALDARYLPAGHSLTQDDVDHAAGWLAARAD